MIILKQVLITGVTMKRTSQTNMLPNKCNKKQAANQEAMRIYGDDVCKIIEEVHKIDNVHKDIDIRLISECEYDEDTSENEEKSSFDEV